MPADKAAESRPENLHRMFGGKMTLAVKLVLGTVLVAYCAGCSGPEGLLQQGNMAYDRGESDRAAEFYRRALESPQTREVASYNLGRLLFEQGRFEEAKTYFDQARPVEVKHPMIRVYRARALWGNGQVQEAEQELREAVRLYPGLSAARFYLARILGEKGEVQQAIQTMAPVRREAGLELEATLSMAEWYRRAGESSRAVELLKGLLENHGYRYENYLVLGQAQIEAGDLNGAESSLRRGLLLNPGEPEGLFALASVFEKQSREELAEKLYIAILGQKVSPWSAPAEERLNLLKSKSVQH